MRTGWLSSAMMRLSRLSPSARISATVGHDAAAMLGALWFAFSVRLGRWYWPAGLQEIALWGGVIAGGVCFLASLQVYRMVVRYTDNRAASRLLAGAGGGALVWFVLAFLSGIDSIPRSVGFIYFVILFLILYFDRVIVGFLLKSYGASPANGRTDVAGYAEGAAIIGANGVGQGLAEALRIQGDLQVRFFVDDNPALVGRTMVGLPIRTMDQLASAARSGEVRNVFLGLSQAGRSERIARVSKLKAMGLNVMALPSYSDLVTGRFRVTDVHPLNVDDLLSREPVPLIPHLIEKEVADRVILITGAGGSIGSEIARKVVGYRPRRVVLLDHAEFALYSIESELRSNTQSEVELVPVMGSLLDEAFVKQVLAEHEIEVVLHAAAYKHVPLLETNEVTGIRNNVTGTKTLADACVAAKVKRFTMISTDKAVRPISLMGASKRVAELYIQALAAEPRVPTCFGIVRFGNVLDSSGSVVQRFRRQIIEGGPVTVTHEDITRFFMSIPEAVELVLQANSLAKGGDVFVLEMGEPVRIAELARTMIALSGLTERTTDNPRGDVAINYVGLRPGEKLYEELFISDRIFDTAHPQIKMARERCLSLADMNARLARMADLLDANDAKGVRAAVADILAIDTAEPNAGDSEPLGAVAAGN